MGPPATLMSSEAFPFNYKHGLWSTNDENRQFLYLFLRQLYSLEAFSIKSNVQQFFSCQYDVIKALLQSETMSKRKRMKMNADYSCVRERRFLCVRKKQKQKANFHEQVFLFECFFLQLIFGGAQRHIHFLKIPFLRPLIFLYSAKNFYFCWIS